jgi:probable rRNA maturation factor
MKLQLINLHPFLRPPPTKWLSVARNLLKGTRSKKKLARIRQLEIVFLDDGEMAKKNWQFKRHRGPTDILTFDYQNGTAEILVSLDTTRRNAKLYKHTWQEELTLYLAHGILHLSGFDDHKKSDRAIMRREEEKLLRTLAL